MDLRAAGGVPLRSARQTSVDSERARVYLWPSLTAAQHTLFVKGDTLWEKGNENSDADASAARTA
jgi:hypothetical protein